MKTVVRILSSAFFVSILVWGFAYAAPWFNLMSLGGMDFFKFFKDDASNVGIEASAFHTRINDSYLPSPVDNYNYIRGKTFLGNDTVVVDASGNLWVGTVSPWTKLEVAGQIKITWGTPWAGKVLTSDAVGLATWSAAGVSGGQTSYITRWLSATTLGTGTIYDNGTNIWVGTVSPWAKLEVAWQVKITWGTPWAGKVLTSDASGLATWTTPAAGISGGQTNYMARWLSPTSLGTGSIYDTGTGVGIGTANPGSTLSVSGTMVANVYYLNTGWATGTGGWDTNFTWSWNGNNISNTNTGNVGIGTVSPAAKLHVNGNIYIEGNNQLAFNTWWGGFYMSDGWWIRTVNNKNIWAGNGLLGSQGWLTIWYGWASSPAGWAIISGNVGIGTSSPTVALTVSGNVIANTPTAASHVATKAYVDAAVGATSGTKVSKIVFTTAGTWNGNLGGFTGADLKCQTEATSAGLTGVYRAILSTDTVNARMRTKYNWDILVNVKGDPITTFYAWQPGAWFPGPWGCDGTSGAQCMVQWINLTASWVYAWWLYRWTGTNQQGANYQAWNYNCANWTSSAGGAVYGRLWNTNQNSWYWVNNSYDSCSALYWLYCMED